MDLRRKGSSAGHFLSVREQAQILPRQLLLLGPAEEAGKDVRLFTRISDTSGDH